MALLKRRVLQFIDFELFNFYSRYVFRNSWSRGKKTESIKRRFLFLFDKHHEKNYFALPVLTKCKIWLKFNFVSYANGNRAILQRKSLGKSHRSFRSQIIALFLFSYQLENSSIFPSEKMHEENFLFSCCGIDAKKISK